MTLEQAIDASPVRVAINTTGRENALVRRYTNGTLAAFQQRTEGPGWTQAPLNHASAVGVDSNAWEPGREQSQLSIPAQ